MKVSSSQVTVLSISLALFALHMDIQDEHFQSVGFLTLLLLYVVHFL